MADLFFRRVWRWHFWAGLVACPVLLVVALTGALYTFREEIEDWLQADVRFVEPVGERKPLSEQITAVKSAHPEWKPTRVTLPADLRKSTVVQVERPGAEKGSLPAVFVNPYTATVIA
ncbi:MAG: PepSY domain-containing protein, partial [Planctomycetes bacterium]|nr:PepSY domain-containing protein [Planctomycetota bacterium]